MLPNNKKRQARWLMMLILIMIVSMLSACGKSKNGAGTPTATASASESRTEAEALKIAKEVKVKLDKGGDFAALAKEYSDDGGSKDNGGRYVNAQIGQWVTEFKNAAATLPINKISDPVKTSFGYHVMKVIDRKENKLADVKESLRTELADKLFSDFMTNDFPTLEYKSNIPTPTPAPSATPAPSTEASPTATPVK
jgi:foldase protein PrsA